MNLSTAQLSPGMSFVNQDCVLYSPSAGTVTQGGVYAIDTTVVANGMFTTVRAVATTDYIATNAALGNLLVVALETTTVNGAKARFRFSGYVYALIETTTNDVAIGDPLTINSTNNYLIKAVDPTGTTIVWQGVCAIAMEARTTNAAGLQLVYFNGDLGARGIAYSLS